MDKVTLLRVTGIKAAECLEAENPKGFKNVITKEIPFETGDMGLQEYGENIREFIEGA
ncbi:MAG: hypothetical protein PVH61_39760 [Candidatus Aminicenantes bacterium]